MTFPRNQPPHGIHGNAWDAVAVSSSGTSGTLDTQGAAFVTAFGNHQGYGLFMASPFASSVLIDNCILSGNITGDRFLQGNFKLGQNY